MDLLGRKPSGWAWSTPRYRVARCLTPHSAWPMSWLLFPNAVSDPTGCLHTSSGRFLRGGAPRRAPPWPRRPPIERDPRWWERLRDMSPAPSTTSARCTSGRRRPRAASACSSWGRPTSSEPSVRSPPFRDHATSTEPGVHLAPSLAWDEEECDPICWLRLGTSTVRAASPTAFSARRRPRERRRTARTARSPSPGGRVGRALRSVS